MQKEDLKGFYNQMQELTLYMWIACIPLGVLIFG